MPAMRETEGRRSLSDEDSDILLAACWEQITLFAFEQYVTYGRGAVFLDRHGLTPEILNDQVDMGYSVYEPWPA